MGVQPSTKPGASAWFHKPGSPTRSPRWGASAWFCDINPAGPLESAKLLGPHLLSAKGSPTNDLRAACATLATLYARCGPGRRYGWISWDQLVVSHTWCVEPCGLTANDSVICGCSMSGGMQFSSESKKTKKYVEPTEMYKYTIYSILVLFLPKTNMEEGVFGTKVLYQTSSARMSVSCRIMVL